MYHDYDGKARVQVEEYAEDLWFLLHHSEEEDRVVLGLRFYLDDSGSDDGSPLVTCGGVALSRIKFKELSKRWVGLYKRNQFSGYTLEPPLHMTDFTMRGKYAAMPVEFKRALFRDVVKIVNELKLYSLSVAIPQAPFQQQLSKDVRDVLIGPYAFAFFTVVLGHQHFSERLENGPITSSYLVDTGFGHYDQLVTAHRLIVDFEKALGSFRHTGALAEDSDDRVPALQVADVVSWASRKVLVEGQLPEGFEPLNEILDENRRHATIPVDADDIKMLSMPINAWIAKYGKVPKLTDIMSRDFNGVQVKLRS